MAPLGDDYSNQYAEPQSGGFGIGSLFGYAASASTTDYFLLRRKAFSRIATGGIPQGIFGLRRIGGRLLRAAARTYPGRMQQLVAPLRTPIGRVGAFMKGTGVPFGRFESPRVAGRALLSESAATALRGRVQSLTIPESMRALGRTSSLNLRWFTGEAGTALTGAERALIGRGLSRAAIFSGVGKIAGGVLPLVNTFLLGKLAIDLASFAGGAAGRTLGALTSNIPRFISNIRQTEFGGNVEALQYSGAITERQRALAAIQGSSINARTMLGSEAGLYSDSF